MNRDLQGGGAVTVPPCPSHSGNAGRGETGGEDSVFPSLPDVTSTEVAICLYYSMGFPGGSVVKNPRTSARALGFIPGWGRSLEEGNGNPIQYSCLGNSMVGGAWWATAHGVEKESVMT